MKNYTYLIISIFLLLSLSSCDKVMVNGSSKSDCVFIDDDMAMDGDIDDEERAILDNCSRNSLTSKDAVIDNLIGEWELTGYAQGWFITGRHPCSTIDVTRGEIILDYKHYGTDTLTVHSWDVEVFNDNGEEGYRLVFEPYAIIELNQFCSDYMFGDFTPSDGNMWLYRKVR